MTKKKPEDLTTEEAIRKLFPAKGVREAKKRANVEPWEPWTGEKPQVDRGDESIEDKSSD
jgi:hypothetical protein